MFFALGGALGEEYPIDLLNKKLLTCLIGTCVDLNGHQVTLTCRALVMMRVAETERDREGEE